MDKITVVEPGYMLLTPVDWFPGMLDVIEQAGRTCYKSENKITDGSARDFVRGIIKRGHESVIEHCVITVKIYCSRACSHQLVRHRIAAYSQESQRYCDYGKLGLQVICPPRMGKHNHDLPSGTYKRSDNSELYRIEPDKDIAIYDWYYQDGWRVSSWWLDRINDAYKSYLHMLQKGHSPEDARFMLPNATKTEVVATFNLRQWRHVFKHRALNKRAQWEIRKIMRAIMAKFITLMPAVFGDLEEEDETD